MSPEKILARAADLVEFSGRWVNHPPRSPKETCAHHAINEACGVLGEEERRTIPGKGSAELARRALVKEIGTERIGPEFNDTKGRTKEEVAAALRNAKRWLA